LLYCYDLICCYDFFRWKQPLPKDDIERVNYVLRLYDRMLDFLLSQGAHLAHVSAQFLLFYDDYVTSVNIVRNNVNHE
jgi:hypothetical protein